MELDSWLPYVMPNLRGNLIEVMAVICLSGLWVSRIGVHVENQGNTFLDEVTVL